MSQLAPSLAELAGRFGIATDYDDWSGRRVGVPESTLVAVLAALGVAAADELERSAAQTAHERALLVARAAADHSRAARRADDVLGARDPRSAGRGVVAARGRDRPHRNTPGRQLHRDRLTWTDAGSAKPASCCPTICRSVTTGCICAPETHEASAALIVTPGWLGLPERLGARRTWGLATQLYSVRSRQSWGVGDLTDLVDLAVWSASVHGAGYVLVNPLHAAAPTTPMEPSPYLPTSRRFVNPLYLRVEAIPEFAQLRKRGRVRRLRDGVQKHAGRAGRDRPRHRMGGQAGGLGTGVRRPTDGRSRAGVRGVLRSRGCRARRLRHLVCAGRRVRRRLARVARVGAASRR